MRKQTAFKTGKRSSTILREEKQQCAPEQMHIKHIQQQKNPFSPAHVSHNPDKIKSFVIKD